ncbi:ligase-associated DNA damage response endonuclease PdeM [Aquimarina agarivorans]|uniref:ligase-associated DNA damage response endonuclease PdeM n=1 Tax=Aquimarina agarivorans TaxID=980584 RepID=UPI000248E69E|nr:ligase-associated DNA damage response endonuclease PdeM [Aquimarina agarivorans]
MKLETIFVKEHSFILHPSGAIFWKNEQMLLIADVHLGKASHFRKHGSPVPMASVAENFNQLNAVVSYFNPTTLCFLGDLFHSHLNNEWFFFEQWIQTVMCKVILVSGNHDIIPVLKYESIGVNVIDFLSKKGIHLTHQPEKKEGFFTISGHIHPGVRLVGAGKQQITIPCFFKQANQLVLPAFGTFTGNFIIEPQLGEQIYGIADDEVIKLQVG